MKKGLALLLGMLLMFAFSAAIAEDDYIFCERCMSYYLEGDDFNYHVCAEEQAVQCSVCGGWYKEGEAFANHTCLATDDYFITCSICGRDFVKGNDYNTHSCFQKQDVQCSVCGGWYEEGNEFRNHVCLTTDDYFITCSICGRDFVRGNDYNTHSCFQKQYVYCSVCGGTYEEGNEYRNHICVPTPDPNQTAIGTLYVDTANGGNLRMRARPDTNANEVTSLKNGTAVTLFSYVNSQWAYVGYRSYFGYCMVRHLSDVAPGRRPAPTPMPVTPTQENLYTNFRSESYYVLVNPSVPTGFVNLRWAPSLDAPVQAIYYANTPLRVIATNGVWCQVVDDQNNVCGFMMSNYMKRLLN